MSLITNDNDVEQRVARALRSITQRQYTLAEIEGLAREWIAEQEGDTEMLKWTFSIFIEWLRKREKGAS